MDDKEFYKLVEAIDSEIEKQETWKDNIGMINVGNDIKEKPSSGSNKAKIFFASIFPEISQGIADYREEEYKEALHKKRMALVSSPELMGIEKHNAEVRLSNAQAKVEEMKAWKAKELNKMLEYIRMEKIKDFPSELHYFVVACQAGDPSALNDLFSADLLKEFLKRKKEAEISKMEHDSAMREQEVEKMKKENEDKDINLNVKRGTFVPS